MRSTGPTCMVTQQKTLLSFRFCQTPAYEDSKAIELRGGECGYIEFGQCYSPDMSCTEHCTENLFPQMKAWRSRNRRPKHVRSEETHTVLPRTLFDPLDTTIARDKSVLSDLSRHVSGPIGSTRNARGPASSRAQLMTPPHSEDCDSVDEQQELRSEGLALRHDAVHSAHSVQQATQTATRILKQPTFNLSGTIRSAGPVECSKRKACNVWSSTGNDHARHKRPRIDDPSEAWINSKHDNVLNPGERAVQAADEDDGCRYVRVGECVDDFARSEDGIDKHSIVVAVVDPAVDKAGSRPQRVTYVALDSYDINGIEVGDYDSADRDISLANTRFRPDDYWKLPGSSQSPQNARLSSYACHELDHAVIKYANQTLCGKRPRTGSRPRKTPLHPRHSLTSWSHTTKLKSHYKGEINAVIAFVNDVAEVELGLPRNFQATLDYDESFSSFMRYILEQRGSFGSIGWMLTDDHSPIEYWADLSIWVLPTTRDRKNREMYEWTASSGKLAKDFLDKHSVKKYGRNLYIEVRIVEDADAKRKNEAWLRRMESESVDLAIPPSPTPPSRKKIGTRKRDNIGNSSCRTVSRKPARSDAWRFSEPVNTAEMALGMRTDEWINEDDEEFLTIKSEPEPYIKLEDG
ncbi:hypothetical protein Slin14017_G116400 [Septoria linicola]|nr:hypothetical protein Slin14017_G116400 [Septoria linicola]